MGYFSLSSLYRNVLRCVASSAERLVRQSGMMPGDAERQKLTGELSYSFCHKTSAKSGVIDPLPVRILVLRSRIGGRSTRIAEIELKRL